MTKIRCLNCKDIIESDGFGKFVQCKCGQCYIDETQYYCRIGGLSDKIEISDGKEWYILDDYADLEQPKIEIKGGKEDVND